jgi:ATP-dependent RNA helicase DDX24/MAK5
MVKLRDIVRKRPRVTSNRDGEEVASLPVPRPKRAKRNPVIDEENIEDVDIEDIEDVEGMEEGAEEDSGKDVDFVEMTDEEFARSMQEPAVGHSWEGDQLSGLLKIEEIDENGNVIDRPKKEKHRKPGVKVVPAMELSADDVIGALPAWAPYGLDVRILAALHKLGFTGPTSIQAAVLPTALKGSQTGICGAAETGSGKTLAFSIPIVQRILSQPLDGKLQAIMIAPTRELALQIAKHVNSLLYYTPLECVTLVGGISKAKQERLLCRKPAILVTTPGRLWDFLSQFSTLPSTTTSDDTVFKAFEGVVDVDPALQHICDVTAMQHVVFDEADQMLANGKFPELKNIWEYLSAHTPTSGRRNVYLFSATLAVAADTLNKRQKRQQQKEKHSKHAPRDKDMWQLFADMLGTDFSNRNLWKTIDVTIKGDAAKSDKTGPQETGVANLQRMLSERMTHSMIECMAEDKDSSLIQFLAQTAQRGRKTVLVFVNAIDSAKRVTRLLSMLNVFESVGCIHSKMQQRQRLTYLERFSAKSTAPSSSKHLPMRILVATDVAARGLDIPLVDMVIHLHIPRRADAYIHRSGRCGRLSSASVGEVFAFVAPAEFSDFTQHMQKIFGEEWRSKVPKKTRESLFISRMHEAALREMMRAARDLEKEEYHEWRVAQDQKMMNRMEGGLKEESAEKKDQDDDESGSRASTLTKKQRQQQLARRKHFESLVKKWVDAGSELGRPKGMSRKFVTIHPNLLNL